jgi:hypothetical protein
VIFERGKYTKLIEISGFLSEWVILLGEQGYVHDGNSPIFLYF